MKRVLAVLVAALAVLAALRRRRTQRTARKAAGALRRSPRGGLRYLRGVGRGMGYRLRRRRPSAQAADDVVADRIRSRLGRLEHELDIPRVHVMVEHHVALLHGEVVEPEQRARIEEAVLEVPGVVAVDSRLHLGLAPGETRPSESRGEERRSRALDRLTAAVAGAGIEEAAAGTVVRTVLGALVELLPERSRRHLFSHLPDDVRVLAAAARRPPRRERARDITEFTLEVAAATGIDPLAASRAVEAVFTAVRELVPEEVDDVAAVLPAGVRRAWLHQLGV